MVVEIYVYLILVSNYFYVNEGHLITRSPTDPEKFHGYQWRTYWGEPIL